MRILNLWRPFQMVTDVRRGAASMLAAVLAILVVSGIRASVLAEPTAEA